jgi:hypothetical protein
VTKSIIKVLIYRVFNVRTLGVGMSESQRIYELVMITREKEV